MISFRRLHNMDIMIPYFHILYCIYTVWAWWAFAFIMENVKIFLVIWLNHNIQNLNFQSQRNS